jgi:hypothetical protein
MEENKEIEEIEDSPRPRPRPIEEIEVSFVTDKQLWAGLKEFCRKKTKQSGERTLIKTVATNSIRDFLEDDKFESGFNKVVSGYNTCLSEYKSLKRKYRYAIYAIWLLGINFILDCIIFLSRYLGV